MNTPALNQYLDYLNRVQGVTAAHPAVVTEVGAPQHATNAPVYHESPEEHRAHEEAMQVVGQALNFILSGNKAMYISPDMMQAIFSEMIQHIEQFKKERAAGGDPAAALARLRASIGPGSHFARKHRNHLDKHHPNHEETHETHADGKPAACIFCHGHAHHGHLAAPPELSHHFSHYAENL